MSLLTSLLACYEFDETSGDADDANGSIDLTQTGSIGSVAGIIGNARNFDGTIGKKFSSTNAVFEMGDTDHSYSVWIKLNSLPSLTVEYIFLRTQLSGAYFAERLIIDSTSGSGTFFAYRIDDGGGDSKTATWGSSVTTGVWYHIVCWFDSAGNEIGITINNGTPVTTATSSFYPYTGGDHEFNVGIASGVIYADYAIDQLCAWSRVITSTERGELYNGSSALDYPFSPPSPCPIIESIATALPPGFGNADLTFNKPASLAAGDLMIVHVVGRLCTDSTPPAGWTLMEENISGNVLDAIYYRVADGSEGSTFVFSMTMSSGDRTVGAILRISGANTTNPINVFAKNTYNGDSAGDQSPTVTTTVDNCLILLTEGHSIVPSTDRVPAGKLSKWQGNNAGVVMTHGVQGWKISAGATGAYQWDISGFADDFFLRTIAVAPVSAGGSPAVAQPIFGHFNNPVAMGF